MKTFHLEIVTPEGAVFDGEAYQVSVRGIEGSLSVFAGHIPFVTALAEGAIRVYEKQGDKPREGFASGGVLTVSKTGCRVLASDFTFSEE